MCCYWSRRPPLYIRFLPFKYSIFLLVMVMSPTNPEAMAERTFKLPKHSFGKLLVLQMALVSPVKADCYSHDGTLKLSFLKEAANNKS